MSGGSLVRSSQVPLTLLEASITFRNSQKVVITFQIWISRISFIGRLADVRRKPTQLTVSTQLSGMSHWQNLRQHLISDQRTFTTHAFRKTKTEKQPKKNPESIFLSPRWTRPMPLLNAAAGSNIQSREPWLLGEFSSSELCPLRRSQRTSPPCSPLQAQNCN